MIFQLEDSIWRLAAALRRAKDSLAALRIEFGLDGGQFRARFVGDVAQPVGATIPVAGVAQIAFELVQHGVNPGGGGIVFVALDELMRGVPLAVQGQFNRPEQFVFWRVHAGCFTGEQPRRQMELHLHQNGRFRKLAAAMKITDVLRAEHAVFHNLFDHIEATVPRLKTLAEVKLLAAVVEKVHGPHSQTEDDLFIEPLEPYFDQMGQRETFHDEHEHIEAALLKVQKAKTFKDAKKILLNAIAASRKHFDKEERIVFPLAERVLKAKTLSELGKQWLHRREVEAD